MAEHYTITIDRDIVWLYKKYYFSLAENKSKKKFYIMNNWKTKKKIPKLLYSCIGYNELLPISPPMYSNIKKQFGEFGLWLAKHYKLNDKNFTNVLVEIKIFSESKTRKDNDNFSSKIINDGLFSESHMLVDDSYFYLNPMIINMDYDKDHPRTEYRISVFDDKIKDVYEKMKIHIEHFE